MFGGCRIGSGMSFLILLVGLRRTDGISGVEEFLVLEIRG